jgi:transposase InsO family protein
MRTLKEEHVDYADYTDFSDAMSQIAQWIEVEYNTQRFHSALNYAAPAEFEMATRTSQSLSVCPYICPTFHPQYSPSCPEF